MITRPYEFYRVIVMIAGSIILFSTGNWSFIGLGAGLLALTVIMHMTTIGSWIQDDIVKELKK